MQLAKSTPKANRGFFCRYHYQVGSPKADPQNGGVFSKIASFKTLPAAGTRPDKPIRIGVLADVGAYQDQSPLQFSPGASMRLTALFHARAGLMVAVHMNIMELATSIYCKVVTVCPFTKVL
jgi:hypothetical protein